MTRVVVVGAGFSGIGIAATLLRDGVTDWPNVWARSS